MFDFFDIFKVDPTVSDPAVAAASGITRDSKGTIHLKHTAASNQLAHNLAAISATAWGPVADGVLVPSVEYAPIASKMLPRAANSGINIGGKTLPLLGMSKSLPSVKGTTALATRATNTGSKWTKGLMGTVALGNAVGLGASERSQKRDTIITTKLGTRLNPKYAIDKYNLKSYNRLVQLQKVYGGDLIRLKDGSYFLRNTYGSFYGNGRALNAKTGKMLNYDLYGSGRFLNSNPKLSNSSNIVSTVLDSNYLYGYRGKPRTRMNNSESFKTAWTNARNSGLGTFTWKGKSYNTMKKGETLQLYDSWLSKLSKPTLQTAPTLGTPGYGIHVGNDSVTLSTPNGLTTDITNSHNVSTLINNGNYKAPNLGNAATNLLENTPLNSYSKLTEHNFNRSDIRLGMRANGLNPYDYSGSDRKLLRTYLNNPTADNYTQSVGKIIEDAKILQNMLNNAVLNLTSKYQLTKPNLANLRYDPNNLLVNLKFKQGGQMYKYATGAQIVLPQLTSGQLGIELLAMALVLAAMLGDKQANLTILNIMLAAQQGDLQAVQVAQLLKTIIQKMQGSRKARLGAKLNYFKLVSECPEGQEVVYFKKGGELCKVCAGKKMQDGGKSDPIKEFKKRRNRKELCKCGAKVAARNNKKKR